MTAFINLLSLKVFLDVIARCVQKSSTVCIRTSLKMVPNLGVQAQISNGTFDAAEAP
jgi:hypothetical protein